MQRTATTGVAKRILPLLIDTSMLLVKNKHINSELEHERVK